MSVQLNEPTRAGIYLLLARLLLQPDDDWVEWLAEQDCGPVSDEGALGHAWGEMVAASRQGTEAIRLAHASLFIAPGTPSINPYESYFVSGRLMDRSLATLRRRLRSLGLARVDDSGELEDHLAALFEALAALIQRGDPACVQREFFQAHLAPWAPACLDQIRSHERAGFYAAMASFAREFLRTEQERLSTAQAELEVH